jgi:hypothetical protein
VQGQISQKTKPACPFGTPLAFLPDRRRSSGPLDATDRLILLIAQIRQGSAMQTLATTVLMSLISLAMAVFSASAPAALPGSLPGEATWGDFSGDTALGSFAWAGEVEYGVADADSGSASLDADFDPQFMTGRPAPEPPAWILAATALGCVICGRSLWMKRSAT